MPSIQVTGQLVDPTTGVEGSADIRIASLINYGQTTKKSISHKSTDASGNYDFQLVYGKHLIFVKYEDERIYIPIGYAVVGDSTPDPIDLIQLINLSDENPPSELVTELQQLREDTLNDIVSTSAQVLENAGYQGEWISGTSTALKGETWQVSGRYYVALKDTSVDPINDNDNWREDVTTDYVNGAQEELLPPGSKIYPESVALTNGLTVPTGTTHLRVLIGGDPAIVEMYPKVSGVVSGLSDYNAVIGTASVRFITKAVEPKVLSSFGVTGVGDESAIVQAAVDYMNEFEVPLSIDIDCTATNIVSNGYTNIIGDGVVYQDNVAGRGWNVVIPTVSIGTYASVANVVEGGVAVTKLTGTISAEVGDVIQVKDSAILAGTVAVNFCETATVSKVDGTGVWLDCRLRHFDYFTSGEIFLMSDTFVSIVGPEFKATAAALSGNAVRLAALTISGAKYPNIDVKVSDDINAGVALRGCYNKHVKALVNNLRDDSSVGSLGYGVVTYGCCKGGEVHVYGSRCRHAYTDGIWDSNELDSFEKGFCLDIDVYGRVVGTTSATWDTHPYSDGCRFIHTDAVAGVTSDLGTQDRAYGYQLRGTNARIIGSKSDRVNALFYDVGSNALIDSVDIVEIEEKENREGSKTPFKFTANISGKAIKLIGKNCRLEGQWFGQDDTNINYVEFEDSIFNLRGTGYQSDTLKEYGIKFKNCDFVNFSNFRVRKGEFSTFNCRRLVTDGSLYTEAIQLFDTVTFRAIGFGFEGTSMGGRDMFVCEAGVTSATIFEYANNYAIQYDGSATKNLIDLNGTTPTIRDASANVVVP